MAEDKGEDKAVTRSESGPTERMPRTARPWDEMDRMFDSFFPQSWRPFNLGRMWSDLSEGIHHPRVDVVDRDNEIIVRAEIPGVDKEDLDVSVTDSTVTVRGERHHEIREEKEQLYRAEISHGAFARTIGLPAEVEAEGASASFKNGMLELKLPKVAKSKRRSIPVN